MRALLAPLLLALPLAALADTVTVFAAASLKEALDGVARAYESTKGHRVVVAYGGSNALARQIENGAPADLLITADLDWMDYLERRGLVAPGSRRNLLGNELVLIAPAASTARVRLEPGLDLAAALGPGRLAVANPDAVPAGKYARAALTSLGVWSGVEQRLARTDNVRAALALVARGEAPLGIVYRTDALAETRVRIVAAFPAGTHPPIVYPLAVLRDAKSPVARDFAAFLGSPPARAAWERFGFRAP